MMRLDKFLSEAGVASRKELKTIIRQGRVSVNGLPAKKPEDKVDENQDTITVDGATVKLKGQIVLMLHKPAGLLSATEDKKQKTVIDLLPEHLQRRGLFPV